MAMCLSRSVARAQFVHIRLYTCFTLSRFTCSRDDDYPLASICLDVLRSQNKNAEAEDCEEAELFTPVEQLEV